MIAPATARKGKRSRILRPFRIAWIQTRRLGLFFRTRYTRDESEETIQPPVPLSKRPIRPALPTLNEESEDSEETSRFAWMTRRVRRSWGRFALLPAPHRAWTFAACTGTIGILLLLWWQWAGRTTTEVVEPTDVAAMVPEEPTEEKYPEGTSVSLLDSLAEKPTVESDGDLEFTRHNLPLPNRRPLFM
jgi:hypothetical protein